MLDKREVLPAVTLAGLAVLPEHLVHVKLSGHHSPQPLSASPMENRIVTIMLPYWVRYSNIQTSFWGQPHRTGEKIELAASGQ